MKKDVMLVTGAGQIGMAIARRVGFGKKIILGDKRMQNAQTIAKIMNDAGYDVEPFEMDLSSRSSIRSIIAKAQEYGEIKYLVNAAGVSPSQAPIEAILKVDLYGTAVLLEEVGSLVGMAFFDEQLSSDVDDFAVVLLGDAVDDAACFVEFAIEHLLSSQEDLRVNTIGVHVEGSFDGLIRLCILFPCHVVLGNIGQLICLEIRHMTLGDGFLVTMKKP